MHNWFGAGTKPSEWIPAINKHWWPPFPTQREAVSRAVWYPLWAELGHDSASKTGGEVSSTQTLWIESVGRVVSQRKTKMLLPEGETDAEQGKTKQNKTQPVCIKQAASYSACHKQGKSHLLAFQTLAPSAVTLLHFLIRPVLTEHLFSHRSWARLWRFQ